MTAPLTQGAGGVAKGGGRLAQSRRDALRVADGGGGAVKGRGAAVLPRPAHADVKVVSDGVELVGSDDADLGRGAAGRRLDLDAADAEPAFEDVARQVNVLDARVRQVMFAP